MKLACETVKLAKIYYLPQFFFVSYKKPILCN